MEPSGKEEPMAVRESPVYEEVGEVTTSYSYTQNVLYGLSISHKLTSDPLHLEECAAYGVSSLEV